MKKVANKSQEKRDLQGKSFHKLLLLALIIIPALIYLKSLNNHLTNWDDEGYIITNPNIRTLHGDSLGLTIKKTFTSYEIGNYHPLTMLTYCMEYSKYKLNPKPYHLTNLLLHLLNTLLVFCFIWLLTRQQWVAFITALLFAVHPMHVESVAWVAERKDVLYSFFYLAALCTYILYLTKEKWKWHFYTLTFLLFILAALSKAMAVSLPLVFFALDYVIGRKMTIKTGLEKIPLIALSIMFGCIAIIAQKSSNAINTTHYDFFDRILFSCYGLMMYIWKLVAPVNLSCFYTYPVKKDGQYPIIFYIAPIIIAIISFLIYRSKRFGKDVVFGFGFFLVTIILVIQLLPVGGTIIAERYTYIPYIGLFFIIARGINNLLENGSEKLRSLKTPLISAFALFVIILCYLTFQRTKVWHDSIALYSDAIQKFEGNHISLGSKIEAKNNYAIFGNIYYNRARAYFVLHQLPEAIQDFTSAIDYNPTYAEAYNNRGNVYGSLGKFDKAIEDFTSAINYDSKYVDAYYNRAGTYFNTKKYQLALNDVLKAQQLGKAIDPRFMEAIQMSIKNAR